MSLNTESAPSRVNKGFDEDCLASIVDAADRAKGGIDDNPQLDIAFDRHVLVEGDGTGDIELMCMKCPVMCTITEVGGTALSVTSNREDCIEEPES